LPFSQSRASVKIDGKWGIIDSTGKTILEPSFEFISQFKDCLAHFMNGKTRGYIDKSGKVIWKTEVN
jgi:hypothetical protein